MWAVPACRPPKRCSTVAGQSLSPPSKAGRSDSTKAAEIVRRDAEPEPDPAKQTATVADKRRAEVAAQDSRYRQKEIRAKFRALTEIERRKLVGEVLTIDDILAWRMNALDSQRREVADAMFNTIASADERLRHDEIVRAWVESYESDERA
jgi:hypothetical protein